MIKLLTTSQEYNDLWYTVHAKKSKLKNKMDEYTSIPLPHNEVCHTRRCNKGYRHNTVCERCYSYVQSSIHPQIRSKMDRNGETLNNPNYTPTKIKTINGRLRYISFGDISTITQAINILRHAKVNPTLHKAVWTKQYRMIKNAIQEVSGIKRLNFIWSASKLNNHKFIIPKHFTKSFYVYTNEEELMKAKQVAQSQGYTTFECRKQCSCCNYCYDNQDGAIILELIR